VIQVRFCDHNDDHSQPYSLYSIVNHTHSTTQRQSTLSSTYSLYHSSAVLLIVLQNVFVQYSQPYSLYSIVNHTHSTTQLQSCSLYYRMCSLTESYYRMCSLTTECVLLQSLTHCTTQLQSYSLYYRMCSLTESYYRMCSLTTECVLLQSLTHSTTQLQSPHTMRP
jgi:hypothetical protein